MTEKVNILSVKILQYDPEQDLSQISKSGALQAVSLAAT
jgi:hypothetical protein